MSTVIKAGQVGTVIRRLSHVDLADHLAEAKAVIDDARRQADHLRAKTREETQRVLVEARAAGFAEGRTNGYEEGLNLGRQAAFDQAAEKFRTEHETLVADFTRAIFEIDRLKEDIRVAATRDVLEFAVGIAVKLTFDIGELHRESALENLKRALELVDDRSDITFRAHPSDLESMKTFAQQALSALEASKVFEVIPDETMSAGGCVVESRRTRVDASLETQTRQIAALLLGREASDA